MSNKLSYNKQFDALRFFAAFVVITHHFFLDMDRVFIKWYGEYGVELFFCLSGFLITSILLEKKGHFPVKKIIKDFIVRRMIRLFPAYYLFLFCMIVLSLLTGLYIGKKVELLWHFAYLSNYMRLFDLFTATQFDHLWTLGVEEQFYIFWPFVILLIPKKLEFSTLIAFISIGLISKYILHYNQIEIGRQLPFYHFDTIGLGALLAYFNLNRQSKGFQYLERGKNFLLLIFSLLFMVGYFLSLPYILSFLILIFFIFFLVTKVHFNFESRALKTLFDNSLIQYLGKISYGLYLFHRPIPLLLKVVLSKMGIDLSLNPVSWYLTSFLLTILVSMLSFRLIETPLSRLKLKFA